MGMLFTVLRFLPVIALAVAEHPVRIAEHPVGIAVAVAQHPGRKHPVREHPVRIPDLATP
jgi:hypothetical protein